MQRLAYRRDRRTRFREHFNDVKNVPIGVIDTRDLAEKTNVPWRTCITYLRELRVEGLVQHEKFYECRYGLKLVLRVWSRIK